MAPFSDIFCQHELYLLSQLCVQGLHFINLMLDQDVSFPENSVDPDQL